MVRRGVLVMQCSKCHVGADFYIAYTGVRSSYCKGCMKQRSREYQKNNALKHRIRAKAWNLENPEKASASVRWSNIKRRFGITKKEYNDLLLKQNGCCAICLLPQSVLDRALAVDHNHGTSKVRGLLCFDCNTALGKFGDNPERLCKAARYLSEGY